MCQSAVERRWKRQYQTWLGSGGGDNSPCGKLWDGGAPRLHFPMRPTSAADAASGTKRCDQRAGVASGNESVGGDASF